MKKVIKVSYVVIFILSCVLMSGCTRSVISVPNGYKLVKTNASEAVIAKHDDNIVLGPTIEGYLILGALVIGKVRVDVDLKNNICSGYFILNTNNGHLRCGLKEAEWLELLVSDGIVIQDKSIELISP